MAQMDCARTVTVAENKRLVLRQFELLDEGQVSAAAALWDEKARNHGREASPALLEKIYRSLRALHETHTVHEVIAEGDWVVVRTTCTGSFSEKPAFPVNSGIFAAVEPNGRKYTNQHIHLFRVSQGKIVEHWANRDDLAVALQIGLELRPAAEQNSSKV